MKLRERIRHFTHDVLGWHDGNGGVRGFDGVSMTGQCSVCGRRVLMDSQGNWFTFGDAGMGRDTNKSWDDIGREKDEAAEVARIRILKLEADLTAARAELAVERRALELLVGELSDNYVFTNGHLRWVAKRGAEHWRAEARAELAKETAAP